MSRNQRQVLRIAECDFDECDDQLITDALRATIEYSTIAEAYEALKSWSMTYITKYSVGKGSAHLWVHSTAEDEQGELHTCDRILMITACAERTAA